MSLNANALTTVARVKIHLRMKPDETINDALLELYVNAASERIAAWCNRVFISTTYTELHSGRRTNYLMPEQYPVTAISELRIDNSRDWTNANNLIDASKYMASDFGQMVQYDGIFPTGFNNVRIIYTAGYAVIPADLEFGCIWLTEWYYRHAQRADMGKTTMGKGDESIGILSKTPEMILETLIDYKRSEFGNSEMPIRGM